jgi:hypothetical protein
MYPLDTRFVVTLGHFGYQVRDFIKVTYPERNFEFAEVPSFEGPGTSLGLSMLFAEKYLQEPFIFHASDTLILGEDKIPGPNSNWVAGSKANSSSQYASFDVASDLIMNFHPKGMMDFDFLHIGLVGIYEFRLFWSSLKHAYESNPEDNSLNDLVALSKMKQNGSIFEFREIKSWFDMGNTESLLLARKHVGEKHEVLEKTDESISFTNNSVIKFFANETVARNRVTRAKSLGELVPQIIRSEGNFYKYGFIDGTLASNKTTPERIKSLLDWSELNLWKPKSDFSLEDFRQICLDFYQKKTIQRVNTFLEKSRFQEDRYQINGLKIPSVIDLLESLDFNWIADGIQTQFHGDFILDNIIQTSSGFQLIDWRQDFGGQILSGDKYYDLAKLQHSLIVNHEIINQNHFVISTVGSDIYCDIYRKSELVESSRVLSDFLKAQNLDRKKVEVLTALIWLNMSPLHHHPFDLFLFNFGKLNLWRALANE